MRVPQLMAVVGLCPDEGTYGLVFLFFIDFGVDRATISRRRETFAKASLLDLIAVLVLAVII